MPPPWVTRTLLEQQFPAELIITLAPEALEAVSHEPTRAFLRDIGIPVGERSWLKPAHGLANGRPALSRRFAESFTTEFPEAPFTCDHWVMLGTVGDDSVTLDTATGEVYSVPFTGGPPYLLNRTLDTFVYFLYALAVETPNYNFYLADDDAEPEEDPQERLRLVMEAAEPEALENPEATWNLVLQRVADMAEGL